MKDYPVVSVVVPAYNHEAYVIEALESVYNQTWPAIELVVQDDCSTDYTWSEIKEWASTSRVKKRFTKVSCGRNAINRGAAKTLNDGIRQTTGQYITILNSDDTYHPQRFEKLLAALQQNSSGFVFSGVRPMDAHGDSLLEDPASYYCVIAPDHIAAAPSPGFVLLKWNPAVTSGNIFISRELQQKVGGFRDYRMIHDWDYLMRCVAWEEPIFLPEWLYNYRIYKGNSFREAASESRLENVQMFHEYFERLRNHRYANPNYPLYANWTILHGFKDLEYPEAGYQIRYTALAD